MTGIMQMVLGGTYGPAYVWPVAAIGDAYGGGFFGGQINDGGTIYNLVVAPKASGESSSLAVGPFGSSPPAGTTSVIDGPTNTANEAALGASWAAATFCNNLNAGSGLNGYKDWYLPAINELEVLYYYLKPTTDTSANGFGANANATAPEPVNTAYSTGAAPTQTPSTRFKSGGAEAFEATYYWPSTLTYGYFVWVEGFTYGDQYNNNDRRGTAYVRAIRRVPT